MDSLKNTDAISLIARIRASDSSDDAFSELVSGYMPLINKRIASSGIPEEEYTEAQQEASIALHDAALSYDAEKYEGVTFGLYASVCISNRLTSYVRARARREERTDDFSEPEDLGSSVDIESDVTTRDAFERAMRVARSKLSELEFRVLCLSVEGYQVRDIAKALGLPSKTVENARYRYRRSLSEDKEICGFLSQI